MTNDVRENNFKISLEVEVEDMQPGMVILYRPSSTGEGKGMRPGLETVRSVANDKGVLNNKS